MKYWETLRHNRDYEILQRFDCDRSFVCGVCGYEYSLRSGPKTSNTMTISPVGCSEYLIT